MYSSSFAMNFDTHFVSSYEQIGSSIRYKSGSLWEEACWSLKASSQMEIVLEHQKDVKRKQNTIVYFTCSIEIWYNTVAFNTMYLI